MSSSDIISVVVGTLLIVGALYLAFNVRQGANTLQQYYSSRAENESSSGWLGRTVFLPGRKTSLLATLTIVCVGFALGGIFLFQGLE
jgi:hypothetical protein